MPESHTPGPLEFAEAGIGDGKGGFKLTEYFVRRPGDDIAVASDIIDPVTGEPSKANAQLFAASPWLLSCLKRALPSLDDGELDARDKAEKATSDEFRQKWLHVADTFKAQADEARAAIAKATGGAA